MRVLLTEDDPKSSQLGRWLERHAPPVVLPIAVERLIGGRSNVTYKVTDAVGRSLIIRRPPWSNVLETAHDLHREFRVQAALGPSGVPVPQVYAYEEHPFVMGSVFYAAEFIDGISGMSIEWLTALGSQEQECLIDSLVDALAEVHRVDIEASGLLDLGPGTGYLARQLSRWMRQWSASKTREVPAVEEVYKILTERLCDTGEVALVHGDFGLHNAIARNGEIAAVLDWELSTLGDPLADVALLAARLDGAPRLAARAVTKYWQSSERGARPLNLYLSFAHWKLACIADGVHARYRAGAMGETTDDDLKQFGAAVDFHSRRAVEFAALG